MKHKKNNELKRFEQLYTTIAPDGKIFFAGNLLQRAAQKWPYRTALICHETEISYKELYDKAAQFTQKLIKCGIKKEDRVLLLWQNSIEFYIAYYGIWQTGAIIAPLNTMLHEAEINHIITDAEPRAIIVSNNLAHKIEHQKNNFTTFFEKDLELNEPIKEQSSSLKIPEKDNDAIAVLLYTSGTTGMPKGVMLSSKNILVNVIQGAARLEATEKDRIYTALPLFHALTQNCCVWAPMLFGCSIIVVEKIERKSLLKGLTHKPTIFLGVPALYGLFCMLKTAPLSGIRYFISGSDVLPGKIRSCFEMLYNRKICNGYGLTETSPFISVNLEDKTNLVGNVGSPLSGIETLIKDDNGNKLPQGEIGVLWVKGENNMLGYFKALQASKAITHEGYLNTGDLAYINKKGNIVLTGRVKDIIIHKGINIYPPEIENILISHEGVTQAAVIGKKIDTDEIPIAFVAGPQLSQLNEAELKKFCAQNLAPYKVPKHIVIMKKLPTTATGKVDKKNLNTQDVN